MQQTNKMKKMTLAMVEMRLKDRTHSLSKVSVSKTDDDYEYLGHIVLVDDIPAFTVGERKLLDHSIKDYFIEIKGKYFYYDVDEFRDIRNNLMFIRDTHTWRVGSEKWIDQSQKWHYDGK